ncbi:MAG: Holliday junction branch migration protein RuvA [Deltaproteobacteria bacterium]|nr:Holliday junction branch migration protein RuvA [Deltaproteobacteria bacterium]
MIGALAGKVDSINGNEILLDVRGVFYEVTVSSAVHRNIPSLGSELKIVVYTDVRENAIVLFGFSSPLEKQAFLLCKKVKGIGSRIALSMISTLGAEGLLTAVGQSDHKALQAIPGVGKKTAERIIVELREQVANYAIEISADHFPTDSGNDSPFSTSASAPVKSVCAKTDAIMALEKLGVQTEKARRAVEQVVAANKGGADVGELLKLALANL